MQSFFGHINSLFFIYSVYIKWISSEWKKPDAFFFLQKGKDTFLEFKTASDFKQQQKCPLA